MKFDAEVMTFDAVNPVASIILKLLRFRMVAMVAMATKLFAAVNLVKLS
jgi:hypothetical protein